MNKKIHVLFLIGFLFSVSSCSPQEDATPTVDVIGSMAAEMAASMQTQTAAAYTPTPSPVTPSPIPSNTPIPEPTKDPTLDVITVVIDAPCYTGPGDTYVLTSNIEAPEPVELLGIGSVPGWYIIRNPYFESPCWIAIDAVELDPNMDITIFPTMTP